ncbi:hypothetical protein [Arcobacter porcinus]|uniref:Uncharacterized protein n=1 Tax=Arcobacter porcinus TaxID=1935204 RepID=A0A5C2HFX4_9BACT|nr:hypothetical protein [Arcobacter porcinus]OCL89481.1 hypothetical protein AAX27_01904 [Aliarcobacter thereius]QEP41034.1 hypothetical protein APORC_1451 [Arcobacter porcinus]
MILATIKEQLATKDKTILAKELGYNNQKNFEKTLNNFLKSSTIQKWCESAYYDLVNSSLEFFVKLLKILNIDDKIISNELEKINLYKKEQDRFKNSYIFVNTDFKRTTQAVHILAILENKRRISLNKEKDLYFKTIDEQLKIVSNIIKNHYKENIDELFIWGKIKSYKVYLEDKIYYFDTNGEIFASSNEVLENFATLII